MGTLPPTYSRQSVWTLKYSSELWDILDYDESVAQYGSNEEFIF